MQIASNHIGTCGTTHWAGIVQLLQAFEPVSFFASQPVAHVL
jgi:hypothetical protein